MKTLLISALALGLSFSSLASFATETTTGNTAAKPENYFAFKAYKSTTHRDMLNVIITKCDEAPVTLSVLSAEGDVLYSTRVANSALKPLNISQLDRGTYTLELTRGAQTERSVFEVK
jgi:hypothetical protein